jgi:Spy/CpxP family protein refolding chaperone
MNRARFLAPLLLAALTLPLAAQAPPPPPPSGRAGQDPEAMKRRQEFMAERLKLTEAQRASFKAIHEKHQASAKARREAAQAAAKAFREAAKDPKVSTDQLRRFHQALADARFEVMAAQRALKLELRAILSPEQREQAAELRGMAQARRHDRMMARRHGQGPGMGQGMGMGPRHGMGPGPGGRPGFEG